MNEIIHQPLLSSIRTNNGFVGHLEYSQYFSPPECDAIIQLAQTFPVEKSTITNEKVENDTHRKSAHRWITHNPGQHTWLWEKIAKLINMANEKYYQFDLVGCLEPLQFTEYEQEGDHYTWHMDHGPGRLSIRKLSVCVELSSKKDYEGGLLEMIYGPDPFCSTQTQGSAIIFPSYTLHRVQPLISGKRYSLVAWANGISSYK
jgi:PKHD-type hydroxylase